MTTLRGGVLGISISHTKMKHQVPWAWAYGGKTRFGTKIKSPVRCMTAKSESAARCKGACWNEINWRQALAPIYSCFEARVRLTQ